MIPEIEIAIRIIAALFLGGIIGLERELDGEAAGIRTHILVAIGAAAFTIISVTLSNDPARIAAGIVTGIGFLGAGTIFRAKDNVRGLTTAAALWCAAAIGLACGMAYYFLAAIVTAAVFFVLILKKLFHI
jgi:putative Mg2+ transporter-C (MgtC) family protein